MRSPSPHRALLAALLLATAWGAVACKSSGSEPPPNPACTAGALGASCAVGADCCSGNCQAGALGGMCVASLCKDVGAACSVGSDCCGGSCVGFTCQNPSTCGGQVGDACVQNSDCCTGACAGPVGSQVCVNPEACKALGAGCSASKDCCEGECGAGGTCVLPEVRCRADGNACSSGDQCCSSQCVGGTCTTPLFCDAVGSACDSSADCCSVRCVAGACSGSSCQQIAESCAKGSDCCSGVCTGGACVALPSGSTNYTCKTLGEACGVGGECCSTNCAGGVCMPSSPSGNAPGDVCYRDDDCASGICSSTAGDPGRCVDSPGSCGLDGYPCTSDSNCCTRKCVDLGTGAKVCQPSGGCRMTGNYCDSTAACCGGTNESDPSIKNTYGIYCDSPGQTPGHPEYDTSGQDSRTCTGGQACNPPGNICGYKASQNCCYEGTGSGKAVCKPDSGGILRCFGGPVNDTCPTGWDANDPDCCKPEGAVCQFRDQCCGGTPCVPDAEGVLRCANVTTCLPQGSFCQVGGEVCCGDNTCRDLGEVGWRCAPANCVGDSCTECKASGTACGAGSECCSGTCEVGVCRAPCVAEAGACTRNDDCCTGLGCSIPDGKTSGTCTASGGGGGGEPTCAATGQSCLSLACCTATDICDAATDTCTAPPTTCSDVAGSCSSAADCCGTLECVEADATDTLRTCGNGDGAACFCADAVCQGDTCTLPCARRGESCSIDLGCCSDSGSFCGPVNGSGACSSANPADCECKPIG